MSVLFGWGHRCHGLPCVVDPADPTRMLCGRDVGVVSVTLTAPDEIHDVCRQLSAELPRDAPELVTDGTCPVCCGDVRVEDGVVADHLAWTWVAGRRRRGSVRCRGVGSEPEAEG